MIKHIQNKSHENPPTKTKQNKTKQKKTLKGDIVTDKICCMM